MKTAAKKSFTIFSIFALLILGVSANATASSTEEHDVMATQFENLAKEMQAKVIEQKEIVKHKPRSSYFGKNRQRIKSHIAYKIRKYEKMAAEYIAQSAYHHDLAAAQTGLKTVSKQAGNKESS
ncbi:MAG: hypothetical protein NMNS01_11640 [Nitrosomonas sp.]|nr:MAG: hypothetical protein NMNS01_11640 [Nitrosomonas sp.]